MVYISSFSVAGKSPLRESKVTGLTVVGIPTIMEGKV